MNPLHFHKSPKLLVSGHQSPYPTQPNHSQPFLNSIPSLGRLALFLLVLALATTLGLFVFLL